VEARTRLDPETADELRRNASRRRAVLRAVSSTRSAALDVESGPERPTPTYESPDGLPGYPVPAFADRDTAVSVDDEALVVAFEVAGVPDEDPEEPAPPLADRGLGGAVLVDRFDVRDGRNPHPMNDEPFAYRLATDRLVVHAPPGTRPVVAPESATVRGDRVVLRSLPTDTNLVFAPAGVGGTLAAHATLTVDTLGWVVPDSFWVAVLPLLQFGLLLRGIGAEKRGSTGYAVAALLLALLPMVAPLLLLAGPMRLLAVGLPVVLVAGGYLLWRTRRDGDGGEGEDHGTDGNQAGAGDDADGGRLPTLAGLRAGIEPWVEPVAVVAAGAAALTVAAAVSAGETPVPFLLFIGGGVLPVAAFVGLGRLAAGEAERPRQHRLLTLLVLVAPWLFAVGHVAGRDMPDSLTTLVLVLGWGSGATLVGFVAHRLVASGGLRGAMSAG
jgi:hypothetical protein